MADIQLVKTDTDIETVVEVAKSIWEEHYTPIIGEQQVYYMLETFQSTTAITKQIENGYQYYLINKDSNVVGYMAINIDKEEMFLSKLYLKKECRGQGLSKEALQFLNEKCLNENVTSIYLTCNKYNSNTLQAYQHLGFKVVDEAVSDIGNGYVMDDYILRKEI